MVRIILITVVCIMTQSSAFAQDLSKQKELSDAVYQYSINCWWRAFIVQKLMSFRLSPGCWDKMLENDGWGIKTVNNVAVDIGEYAKRLGYGDLEAAESANNNDRNANKPRVEQMVDGLKDKITVDVQADGIKCSDSEWDLLHRYLGVLGEFLARGDWTPRGGAAHITMVASGVAKDISVAISPDGKHFTITAPVEVEPSEWDTKITKGLQRGGK